MTTKGLIQVNSLTVADACNNTGDSTLGLKFHVNGSLSVAVALTEWTLLRACCKKKNNDNGQECFVCNK